MNITVLIVTVALAGCKGVSSYLADEQNSRHSVRAGASAGPPAAANQEEPTKGDGLTTATGAVLKSLALQTSKAQAPKGLTSIYKAVATYSDDSTQDVSAYVTWSSSDEAVARFAAEQGVVLAERAGAATLKATLDQFQGEASFEVLPAVVVALRFPGDEKPEGLRCDNFVKGDAQMGGKADTSLGEGIRVQTIASDCSLTDVSFSAQVTWESSNRGIGTFRPDAGPNYLMYVQRGMVNITARYRADGAGELLAVKTGYQTADPRPGDFALTTAERVIARGLKSVELKLVSPANGAVSYRFFTSRALLSSCPTTADTYALTAQFSGSEPVYLHYNDRYVCAAAFNAFGAFRAHAPIKYK